MINSFIQNTKVIDIHTQNVKPSISMMKENEILHLICQNIDEHGLGCFYSQLSIIKKLVDYKIS